MIQKIQLSNIGSFNEFATKKKFQRNVLISGENGPGKSTLTAVLRSLRNNDPEVIAERQPVGSTFDPTAIVTTDEASYEFDGEKWTDQSADLWIFDTAFVNQNIHSGNILENDHRKCLYSVILGDSCEKKLAEQGQLAETIDEHNQELRRIQSKLETFVPTGLTLDEFLALEKKKNLESQIQKQRDKVASYQHIAKIQRAPGFQSIIPPELTEDFAEVLAKTMDSVSEDAEQKVTAHVQEATNSATVAWIEKGLSYEQNDECPFCGTDVAKSDLIKAYRDFFNREYNTLKAETNSLTGMVDRAFGEAVVVQNQQILSENNAARQFWDDHVDIPPLEESVFADISDEIGHIRDMLLEAAREKRQNPLESVNLKQEPTFGDALLERINDYNTLVEVANDRIKELKADQEQAGRDEDVHLLAQLEAIEARFQDDVLDLIEQLDDAKQKKSSFNDQRKTLQNDIEDDTRSVFDSHGELINKILAAFEAGFRLGAFDTNNRTKPPSVVILVEFDGKAVKLGDKVSKSQRPFGATLSGAERLILAFAFFVARVIQDEALANKVVIVDDPVTNLDGTRLRKMSETVADLGGKAKQLILLSHNGAFLDLVAEQLTSPQRLTLETSGDEATLATS